MSKPCPFHTSVFCSDPSAAVRAWPAPPNKEESILGALPILYMNWSLEPSEQGYIPPCRGYLETQEGLDIQKLRCMLLPPQTQGHSAPSTPVEKQGQVSNGATTPWQSHSCRVEVVVPERTEAWAPGHRLQWARPWNWRVWCSPTAGTQQGQLRGVSACAEPTWYGGLVWASWCTSSLGDTWNL